jgi:hypothetical protein
MLERGKSSEVQKLQCGEEGGARMQMRQAADPTRSQGKVVCEGDGKKWEGEAE